MEQPTLSVPDVPLPDGPPPLTGKVLFQLSKFRLSFLVVLSGVIAYALGTGGTAAWWQYALFILAGFLITVSANIVNQIVEIGPDAQMARTRNRPLPSGRLAPATAWLMVIACGVGGVLIYAAFFTWLSLGLAALSWALYGFLYTPLKARSPIAVAVGAIPGAMPLLIGYAAATGTLEPEAWLLYVGQFVWQFPHFWAIAWVLADDYALGGFYLLPSPGGRRGTTAALLILVYTLLLLPAGITPYLYGYVSLRAAIAITLAGLALTYYAIQLYRRQDVPSAKAVMFGSFLYLPIAQGAVLLDRLV